MSNYSRDEYGDLFEAVFPTLFYYFILIHMFDEENSNYDIITKKLDKMSSEVQEKFINLEEEIRKMLCLEDI